MHKSLISFYVVPGRNSDAARPLAAACFQWVAVPVRKHRFLLGSLLIHLGTNDPAFSNDLSLSFVADRRPLSSLEKLQKFDSKVTVRQLVASLASAVSSPARVGRLG